MASFWGLILFLIDEFFIFRLESVIRKKYASTNGKESKYTYAIDVSIIWLYSKQCHRLCCRLFCRLTVDCTLGCSVDCTVDCNVDCSLLCNISSFLFLMSAASL